VVPWDASRRLTNVISYRKAPLTDHVNSCPLIERGYPLIMKTGYHMHSKKIISSEDAAPSLVSYCGLLWGGKNIFSWEVDLLWGANRGCVDPEHSDECISESGRYFREAFLTASSASRERPSPDHLYLAVRNVYTSAGPP
jgi:hypothetical protein